MGRVFAVRPKRIKRTNGQVLTPDMEITVTTQQYTSDPFYNGATFAARKRSRMGDIYHCGRSRAERGRLPWLCLKPLPSLPAPRLSSCGGKRRGRSSKTSF